MIKSGRASGQIVINDPSLTTDKAWSMLTEMFSGRSKCWILGMKKLIARASSNPIGVGSEYEDIGHPHIPFKITEWEPGYKRLKLTIGSMEAVEKEKRRWYEEYEFQITKKDITAPVVINIKYIHHANLPFWLFVGNNELLMEINLTSSVIRRTVFPNLRTEWKSKVES